MRSRHGYRSVAALGLALLLAGAGCGETTTEPNTSTADASGRADLPYNPDPPKDATIVANLVGDPDLDGGCVWLRQGVTDFGVLWPPGFTADFNPVRLYDGDDNLVAGEGDQLEVTGGFAADAAAYRPHRCVVGSALWLAGQVSKAG